MRLLLTTDTVGGVWEYSATLARGIEAAGHAVLVAVVGHPSENQLALMPSGAAIDVRDEPLEWMLPPEATLARTAGWISDLATKWGADVVHLNQMAYTAMAAFTAPTLVVVHSDVYSWFEEVLGTSPSAEWKPYARVISAGIRTASIVAAPSRYQAALTERHFGRAVDVVIHNGVDLPHPSPPRQAVPLLLLTSGRAWDRAKGIDLLDEALGLLSVSLRPDAHLLGSLVGPRGERFEGHFLTTHGQVSAAEMRRWMHSATIYVAPSRYEPFGLAPAEAALSGCALLMSDIASFRELWGDAAHYFPSGQVAGLAAAVAGLLTQPGEVRRLAEAAQRHAMHHFGASRFVEVYLGLYAAMAAGRKPGGVCSPSGAERRTP